VCFSCFCRWRWLSPPAEEDREEEDSWSTDFWSPLAAARETTRRQWRGRVGTRAASCSCLQFLCRRVPLQFQTVRGLFCKVWIIWCNFYLFFEYYNLYWGCKKKRKKEKNNKKKKKKKKKRETKMYVCIYFRDFLWWDDKRIKKNLIFWSDHGVEVQTCTEVVFLKSDEKTKFFKLL